MGVSSIWGGGSHLKCKSDAEKRHDKEWEEIGNKVELKVMRNLKDWADDEESTDNSEEWDEIGEASDPRAWEWARVLEAEPAALEAFARSRVETPVIFAVVGEKERVGMDALRAVGTLQEVQPETLFGYGPFPKSSKDAVAR